MIIHPAINFSLAMCDFQHISWENDFIGTTLKYCNHDSETFVIGYNPVHMWNCL
ncbi:hypothetical protein BU17DRAFT_35829 [Hysterangium stoloniferum]|nr:hypothetical protein BU17DRAFT_35829 [Hysterangium stoloniferum]